MIGQAEGQSDWIFQNQLTSQNLHKHHYFEVASEKFDCYLSISGSEKQVLRGGYPALTSPAHIPDKQDIFIICAGIIILVKTWSKYHPITIFISISLSFSSCLLQPFYLWLTWWKHSKDYCLSASVSIISVSLLIQILHMVHLFLGIKGEERID